MVWYSWWCFDGRGMTGEVVSVMAGRLSGEKKLKREKWE